jgi:hypothetical protein
MRPPSPSATHELESHGPTRGLRTFRQCKLHVGNPGPRGWVYLGSGRHLELGSEVPRGPRGSVFFPPLLLLFTLPLF